METYEDMIRKSGNLLDVTASEIPIATFADGSRIDHGFTITRHDAAKLASTLPNQTVDELVGNAEKILKYLRG